MGKRHSPLHKRPFDRRDNRRCRRSCRIFAKHTVYVFCARASRRKRIYGARSIYHGRSDEAFRTAREIFCAAYSRLWVQRACYNGNALDRVGARQEDNHNGVAAHELQCAPANILSNNTGIFRGKIPGIYNVDDIHTRHSGCASCRARLEKNGFQRGRRSVPHGTAALQIPHAKKPASAYVGQRQSVPEKSRHYNSRNLHNIVRVQYLPGKDRIFERLRHPHIERYLLRENIRRSD